MKEKKAIGLAMGGHVILLALTICLSKWIRGWYQFTHFSNGHCPHEGREVGFGTNYLGSFYAGLDECVDNVMRSVGQNDVVTHADTRCLQYSSGNVS